MNIQTENNPGQNLFKAKVLRGNMAPSLSHNYATLPSNYRFSCLRGHKFYHTGAEHLSALQSGAIFKGTASTVKPIKRTN